MLGDRHRQIPEVRAGISKNQATHNIVLLPKTLTFRNAALYCDLSEGTLDMVTNTCIDVSTGGSGGVYTKTRPEAIRGQTAGNLKSSCHGVKFFHTDRLTHAIRLANMPPQNFIFKNRNAMNPTQFELAILAANVTSKGSPEEAVEVALALWEAAGKALLPPPPDPNFNETLKSNVFLRRLLPDHGVPERMALFRQFLDSQNRTNLKREFQNIDQYDFGPDGFPKNFSAEEIDDMVRKETDRMVAEQGLRGVPHTTQTADEFRKWDEKRAKNEHQKKTSKGGIVTAANNKEKKRLAALALEIQNSEPTTKRKKGAKPGK